MSTGVFTALTPQNRPLDFQKTHFCFAASSSGGPSRHNRGAYTVKTILLRHMVGIATFLFLIAVGYAADANAQTPIPSPQCVPLTSACTKVVTFYNNGPDPIYPVIQAGIQSPDPWLQALFNNDNNMYHTLPGCILIR